MHQIGVRVCSGGKTAEPWAAQQAPSTTHEWSGRPFSSPTPKMHQCSQQAMSLFTFGCNERTTAAVTAGGSSTSEDGLHSTAGARQLRHRGELSISDAGLCPALNPTTLSSLTLQGT